VKAAEPAPEPRSGLDHLHALIGDARQRLHALVELSTVSYDDVNASGGAFFIGWNKWQWGPLPADAQPHVGFARKAVERLTEFAEAATAAAAPDRLEGLRATARVFMRVIEQPNGSLPNGAPGRDRAEIASKIDKQLDDYRDTLGVLPSAHGGDERLLVADTSALLDRPDLQNWRIDGSTWTVVLMPTVLSELDERKRDPRTRDAAQTVIRQIEEFDRRGDTLTGVPLSGNLQFREIPVTPDMSRTLPWLRSDVADDVIVAGALELTWADLTAQIALAASDRNVRNKARLAGLGVVKPTEL